MNNWGANHGAFSYGHIGAELITLAHAAILVYMHNVTESGSSGRALDGLRGARPARRRLPRLPHFGPLYGD